MTRIQRISMDRDCFLIRADPLHPRHPRSIRERYRPPGMVGLFTTEAFRPDVTVLKTGDIDRRR
jgi:hypothetical protein